MKIEIGESLACSYLRHVERCWLVQANWKAPEHWGRRLTDAELEALFEEMKSLFDPDGVVFKKTKNAAQFLKQGEIDVVGVDQQGGVHAMEVAFHEAGLNYGSKAETVNRVLKKMLRTLLILRACHPPQTPLYIYFLSPKVNPAVQRPLEEKFAALRQEYPHIGWSLLTNADFAESVVKPTLENASDVADSSELFLRSAKLLETAGYRLAPPGSPIPTPRDTPGPAPGPDVGVQPLVKSLMQTLLVADPALLSEAEKRDLQDNEYCKSSLGLQIGNFALIRRIEEGRIINGHGRYWADRYGGFYVCSQWWKQHHHANAQSLLAWVEDLIERKAWACGRPPPACPSLPRVSCGEPPLVRLLLRARPDSRLRGMATGGIVRQPQVAPSARLCYAIYATAFDVTRALTRRRESLNQ